MDAQDGIAFVGVGVIWLVVSLLHHEGVLGARVAESSLLGRLNSLFWLLMPRLGVLAVVAGSCVILVNLLR